MKNNKIKNYSSYEEVFKRYFPQQSKNIDISLSDKPSKNLGYNLALNTLKGLKIS